MKNVYVVELGQDRRTLWMACFYDMSELKIQLVHVVTKKRMKGFKDFLVPVWSESDESIEPYLNQFYTMRVCKDCRGDWMGAIKGWYASVPDHFLPEDEDRNIPMIVGGRTVMMNRKEYDEYETRRNS